MTRAFGASCRRLRSHGAGGAQDPLHGPRSHSGPAPRATAGQTAEGPHGRGISTDAGKEQVNEPAQPRPSDSYARPARVHLVVRQKSAGGLAQGQTIEVVASPNHGPVAHSTVAGRVESTHPPVARKPVVHEATKLLVTEPLEEGTLLRTGDIAGRITIGQRCTPSMRSCKRAHRAVPSLYAVQGSLKGSSNGSRSYSRSRSRIGSIAMGSAPELLSPASPACSAPGEAGMKAVAIQERDTSVGTGVNVGVTASGCEGAGANDSGERPMHKAPGTRRGRAIGIARAKLRCRNRPSFPPGTTSLSAPSAPSAPVNTSAAPEDRSSTAQSGVAWAARSSSINVPPVSIAGTQVDSSCTTH